MSGCAHGFYIEHRQSEERLELRPGPMCPHPSVIFLAHPKGDISLSLCACHCGADEYLGWLVVPPPGHPRFAEFYEVEQLPGNNPHEERKTDP